MKKFINIACVALAMGSLAGCHSLPFGKDHFDDDNYATKQESRGQAMSSAAGSEAVIEERDSSNEVASKKIFYFKFDNATVAQKDYQTVREQARYLQTHPDARVILDGHTDERGAREYNLALGERRAKSVAELLKMQGANPRQVEVVSHGQEKPMALGHSEDAWRLNRRVEVKFTG